MKNCSLLILSVFVLSLTACSTASVKLLLGPKGIHKVLARGTELASAKDAAVKAAVEYCEDFDKEAIFVKPKSNRKTIRPASNVNSSTTSASAIDSPVRATAAERDYFTAALFKCRAVN